MNQLAKVLQAEILKLEEGWKEGPDPYRPKFHVAPPVGWLNDPNGLCRFKGKYHVFFQYSPFDVQGGLKVWGHAVSQNLTDWEYRGTPLLPDTPYDCHGVYSGSALAEDGVMHLFYTGNVKLEDQDYDYITGGRGSCVLHVSTEDGIHFTNKRVLLKNSDYPEDYTCHIRDPKVWKEDGKYRMILGGRKKEDKGCVLFYQSEDLRNWNLEKELSTEEPFGYMWECPDLFSSGEEKILSVSPQGLEKEEYRYQNIYQSGYFLMNQREEGTLKEFHEWDYGFDFYAPQTFEDEKGRRILIGWMGMPDSSSDYQNLTLSYGWQHVLTLPREITVKNGKVYQNPVEEMKALRKEKTILKDGQNYEFQDLFFEVETAVPNTDFSLRLDNDLHLEYEKSTQILKLSFSGKGGGGRTSRKTRIKTVDSVRMIADASCAEFFINEGETVFSTRYYPQNNRRTLKIEGTSGETAFYPL